MNIFLVNKTSLLKTTISLEYLWTEVFKWKAIQENKGNNNHHILLESVQQVFTYY